MAGAGHAPVLRVLNNLERMRVFEQRLGRNASPEQPLPAERLLFLDNGDSQTELSGADGGDVPPGPSADHDDVVFPHRWVVAGSSGRAGVGRTMSAPQ